MPLALALPGSNPLAFAAPPPGCNEYKRALIGINPAWVLKTIRVVFVRLTCDSRVCAQLPHRRAIRDKIIPLLNSNDAIPSAKLHAFTSREANPEDTLYSSVDQSA